MNRILLMVSMVLLTIGFTVIAQERTVSGTISDENGDALVGASVTVQGTTQGTVTDVNGNFSLSVSQEANLVISFVGYTDKVIAVGNQTTINTQMELDVTELTEVVVTAFGMEREKKALGYSITEVSGDDFTEARENNVVNSLSGKVAGVNVSGMATGPAGSSRVVIRGNVSLTGNNQPLYVIDGVPMDNSGFGQAGMWGGSDQGDGTGSLNPDDIQTISVLKGATAAALYGSRASNGVILITTKSGKGRKGLGVEYNSNYVVESVLDFTDFQTEYGHGSEGRAPLDADEGLSWGASSWGGPLNDSNVYQFDGEQRPYSYAGNNIKNFYSPGSTFTNTIALTGGNDEQNFRFSFSDMNNKSMIPNATYKRRNFGLNANGRYNDKLFLSTSIRYSNEDVAGRPRLSDAPGNANLSVYYLPPSIDVMDLKGTTDKWGANEQGTEMPYYRTIWSQNPWWAQYQYINEDVKDRVIGNVRGRVNFTDWLYLQGRIGMDYISRDKREVVPYGTGYSPRGSVNDNITNIRETNIDWLAGVDKDLGSIGINAFVGGNAMRRSWERISSSGNTLIVPHFHRVSNAVNQSTGWGYSSNGINSLFGSFEFSYNGYLFLTATGRNDWFSTLEDASNSIFYPSVGLSYVFSDMIELPAAVTFAKFRTSWAQVGGGASPYKTRLNYGLQSQGHLGQALVRINQGAIPNAALVPLVLTEYEVGFDLKFFDNRLGLDLAYYNRATTNDILDATISQTSGYTGRTVNVGKMRNYGIESMIYGEPVVTGDLSWEVGYNFAINKNEVVSLMEGQDFLPAGESRTREGWIRHIVGEPYSAIVGYTHLEENGQKVYDANGYPVRNTDLSILGYGVHPFTSGLINTINYKDFSLSFLIDMQLGGSLYSGTNVRATGNGLHKQTLEGRDGSGITVSGVDEDGNPLNVTIAAVPGLGDEGGDYDINNYWYRHDDITEYYVYDASFAKLRQFTFGYNFPKSILSGTPFQNASLSFVARNLFLLYSKVPNIDPESNYQNGNGQGLEYFGAPPARTYGFNLRVNF